MVILSDEQIVEAEKGMWRQAMEKDACGVGFVTSIKGIPSHKVNFKCLKITILCLDSSRGQSDAGTNGSSRSMRM